MKKCYGITLIELLIVLAIVAFLANLGGRLWTRAAALHRTINYLRYMERVLNEARLDAVAQGRDIIVVLPKLSLDENCVNYQLRNPNVDDWLKWRLGELSNRPRQSFIFTPSGKLAGGNGRITYCTPYGNFQRELVISSTGRARINLASKLDCETATDA